MKTSWKKASAVYPITIVGALGVGAAIGAAGNWFAPSLSGLGQAVTVFLDGGTFGRVGLGTSVLALMVGAGLPWLALRRSRASTAAREQDAELARMSWRLDFALAASEVGVWDVDLKTDQMIWDERARTLFGVAERDGFYGEADWLSVVHPEDRDRALAAANAAVAMDGRFVQDYRVVLPGDRIRHVRDLASVYRGAAGSHRLVGLVWDVTADVERQQELELRRTQAEAATAAKSQFLAVMSHEIRTPLGGVLGMLDLMQRDVLSNPQRERATIAHSSARSLLHILNDVLDFSKLEAHQIRLRAEPVNPRTLVGDVTYLMTPNARQKGLELTHTIADTVPEWVVTDGLRLRQVLINLVSNATKFTASGRIEVQVDYFESSTAGELRVEVMDTGIGIAPAMCDQVFEKFVQADTSLSRAAGGTGLGLSISRQLVELMGGRIGVSSAPGAGSTFSFTIAVQAATAPAMPANAPLDDAVTASPPLRILLAEDNATNQLLVTAYLTSAGHAVTVVGDGMQAVAAVQAAFYDVILMDVQMPQMDGISATRAIRSLTGPAARIPIIALTANTLSGDGSRFTAAGMTDVVPKPIDREVLHRALERARAAGGAVTCGEGRSKTA